MAGTPLAGVNGRVAIGGVALTQAKWSVKPKGILLPSTNFESVAADGLTYAEQIFGIRSAAVTFSGFWDAAANPHVTFGIVGGAQILNVQIFLTKTINKCFAFPFFSVEDVTVDDDVTGLLTISVSGMSNGPFTYPF